MKADKIRQIDSGDLQRQLSELDEQMFRLRFQLRMGQSDGVKRVRELRRDKARMLTVLRQRELAGPGSQGPGTQGPGTQGKGK